MSKFSSHGYFKYNLSSIVLKHLSLRSQVFFQCFTFTLKKPIIFQTAMTNVAHEKQLNVPKYAPVFYAYCEYYEKKVLHKFKKIGFENTTKGM